MRGELVGRYVGGQAYDFEDEKGKRVAGITVWVACPNDGREGSLGFALETYTAAADLRGMLANLRPLAEAVFLVEAKPGQKKFRIVGVRPAAEAKS
jgi:hypothetical protein